MSTRRSAGPSWDFLVDRSDFRNVRLDSGADPATVRLQAGDALLTVSKFALTANNITYAAAAGPVDFWSFFPAPGNWGRIPVWGFADVTRGNDTALEEGERIFGYLPMSTHVIMRPDRVGPATFFDAAQHRQALPRPYNFYRRLRGEADYAPQDEHHHAILRPLFLTSFVIDDLLAEGMLFGAETVVVSSASSKTAIGLAFLLRSRAGRKPRIVGLTSAGNVAVLRTLGWYDHLASYDDMELHQEGATVFVDFAGNARLVQAVHEQLGARLLYSCRVGSTHWEQLDVNTAPAGPAPVFFFGPDRIRKRSQDWGAAVFEARFSAALKDFVANIQPWLRIETAQGPDALEASYRSVLEARVPADVGYIVLP